MNVFWLKKNFCPKDVSDPERKRECLKMAQFAVFSPVPSDKKGKILLEQRVLFMLLPTFLKILA